VGIKTTLTMKSASLNPHRSSTPGTFSVGSINDLRDADFVGGPSRRALCTADADKCSVVIPSNQ